jgi:predicted dehydrogenase
MAQRSGFGIGIVGCGMVADFHARAIAAMRGGHLVGVFSRREANARRLAARHGVTAYTNYRAFLADPQLDIVTIATPSGAHLAPAEQAARAGKHVICEKPLEVTLARIDRLIRVCRENGVMLAGIFQRRFLEATQQFKQAVAAGRLGRISLADAYVKWYRSQGYYDSGAWRGTWKLDGGGALINQAIHTIDLLYYLAGDVEWVCGFADRRLHARIETEDNAVAILKFRSGALGVIQGSTACYAPAGHPAEVHLCGSDGSIFMRDNSFTVWEFRRAQAADRMIRMQFAPADGPGAGAADPAAIDIVPHQRVFEDAVRALENGTAPLVDGPEGRKAVEIILAIYQSALAGGKPVRLPLKRTPARKPFG